MIKIAIERDRKQLKALQTVGQLVVASPRMVNRVNYKEGSLTTTYETLLTLRQADLVESLAWRVHEDGNPRVAYCLTTLGYRELVAHGIDRATLLPPSRQRTLKRGPLGHLLDANACIVQALELARVDPSFTVRFVPEPLLRRHPLKKGDFTLIPDAWVQIKRGSGEATFLFEVDKSTIPLERLAPRIRGYLALDQSPEYHAIFGTLALVVVWVVAAGGLDRVESLRRLTRALLGPAHPQADLFCFGVSDTSYFDAAWFVAEGATPHSLLPPSWRVHGQT